MPEGPQGQKRDWIHIVLSNISTRFLMMPIALIVVVLVYVTTLIFPSVNKTGVALGGAFFCAAVFVMFFGGRYSKGP